MTPLEILRRSFRLLAFPDSKRSGVYLLVLDGDVIYCGASRTNVFSRVGQHSLSYEFNEALWYPLPAAVVFDYEGAFTRFLEPKFNKNSPFCRGFDNEILEGFGLPPHRDPEAVTRKWHLKRYGIVMKPKTYRAFRDRVCKESIQ